MALLFRERQCSNKLASESLWVGGGGGGGERERERVTHRERQIYALYALYSAHTLSILFIQIYKRRTNGVF